MTIMHIDFFIMAQNILKMIFMITMTMEMKELLLPQTLLEQLFAARIFVEIIPEWVMLELIEI